MRTRTPNIEHHGLFAFHDQACAVHHREPALFNCNTGVFEPSWKAQTEGWRLVRAQTWFHRLLLRAAFPTPTVDEVQK